MKTKVSICLFWIFALTCAFYMKANAQQRDKCPSVVNSDTLLLADETTLNWVKSGAKIHCTNESVFNELFKSHGTLFKRFTCTWKTDRKGRYKDYVIYLNRDDADYVIKWAKINL
jgi:hypothetical protein